jgi:hypothetical protein
LCSTFLYQTLVTLRISNSGICGIESCRYDRLDDFQEINQDTAGENSSLKLLRNYFRQKHFISPGRGNAKKAKKGFTITTTLLRLGFMSLFRKEQPSKHNSKQFIRNDIEISEVGSPSL